MLIELLLMLWSLFIGVWFSLIDLHTALHWFQPTLLRKTSGRGGGGGGAIFKVQFFKFFALNIYFYGKTTLQFVIEEQAVKDAVVHYHCFYHCHLRLEHFLIMESRLLLVSCFLVSQLLLNPPRAV